MKYWAVFSGLYVALDQLSQVLIHRELAWFFIGAAIINLMACGVMLTCRVE